MTYKVICAGFVLFILLKTILDALKLQDFFDDFMGICKYFSFEFFSKPLRIGCMDKNGLLEGGCLVKMDFIPMRNMFPRG